jgi:Ni,Fe-hydrogenase maturation factor
MLRIAMMTGVLKCPVSIVGVEPKDVSLGEGLSQELISALPGAVRKVLKELGM